MVAVTIDIVEKTRQPEGASYIEEMVRWSQYGYMVLTHREIQTWSRCATRGSMCDVTGLSEAVILLVVVGPNREVVSLKLACDAYNTQNANSEDTEAMACAE